VYSSFLCFIYGELRKLYRFFSTQDSRQALEVVDQSVSHGAQGSKVYLK